MVEDSPVRVDWEPSSHQTRSRSAIWQSTYVTHRLGARTSGTIRGQRRHGRNYPPETGLSVIIVTNRGNWTGAVRKTSLMRVKDGDSYVLVDFRGAAPKNPEWVYNLRSDGNVQLREEAEVYTMRVREVDNADERARLWDLAVAAFPPYAEYRDRTTRRIPLFVAEPA